MDVAPETVMETLIKQGTARSGGINGAEGPQTPSHFSVGRQRRSQELRLKDSKVTRQPVLPEPRLWRPRMWLLAGE